MGCHGGVLAADVPETLAACLLRQPGLVQYRMWSVALAMPGLQGDAGWFEAVAVAAAADGDADAAVGASDGAVVAAELTATASDKPAVVGAGG